MKYAVVSPSISALAAGHVSIDAIRCSYKTILDQLDSIVRVFQVVDRR